MNSHSSDDTPLARIGKWIRYPNRFVDDVRNNIGIYYNNDTIPPAYPLEGWCKWSLLELFVKHLSTLSTSS